MLLVLINLDNPSGNYIPAADIQRLIAWCGEKKILLVLDESFADFASESDNSMIDQKILNDNSHLFVMKSISKAFGVPGLRLGVLASQANYVTVELTNGMTSQELAEVLLDKDHILIKDLSSKMSSGQYIRLAVRNREDNQRLLSCLGQRISRNS